MSYYDKKAAKIDDDLKSVLRTRLHDILDQLDTGRQDYLKRFIASAIEEMSVEAMSAALGSMREEYLKVRQELSDRIEKSHNLMLEKSKKFDVLFHHNESDLHPETILGSKKMFIDRCLADISTAFNTEVSEIKQRSLRWLTIM